MWNPEATKLIKENFVAVAVAGHVAPGRKDAEGEFVRSIGLKLAGAGGNIEFFTAAGKRLGSIYPAGKPEQSTGTVKGVLAKWNQLPANERAPGAVKIGERGPIDPNVLTLLPPAGGLILKVSYRTLTRTADGGLRHAVAKDFAHRDVQVDWVTHFGETFEAQPDFMWLKEAEWKSLVPAGARKGSKYPVPPAVAERLVRFHLDPTMAYGESGGWDLKSIRSRELTLTVTDSTPDKIDLRLDGFVLLGADYAAYEKRDKKGVREGNSVVGYEPKLLGFLSYDVKNKTFTRFDLVALGDTYGTLGGDTVIYYRPGRQPLGVAFELVGGNAPAERIPPRAAVVYNTVNPQYLGTGK